jgi:hypothetical protein
MSLYSCGTALPKVHNNVQRAILGPVTDRPNSKEKISAALVVTLTSCCKTKCKIAFCREACDDSRYVLRLPGDYS